MNKTDLIKMVANETGNSQSTTKVFVESMLTNIAAAVSRGEEVDLHGFGKFKPTERAARVGRNPATGEVLQIAASKSVSFKPAKVLKELL